MVTANSVKADSCSLTDVPSLLQHATSFVNCVDLICKSLAPVKVRRQVFSLVSAYSSLLHHELALFPHVGESPNNHR